MDETRHERRIVLSTNHVRTLRSHPAFSVGAVVFAALLLPLMVLVSPDYGATWDDELQQRRGSQIVKYYVDRVGDLRMAEDGSHFYGAPFDVVAVLLQRSLPSYDPYVVRHALNAAVSWLGVVLCGLIAHRLFGPPTALLAMVLLATMPRYWGHSMNNPKDIPFATAASAVLYLLCCLPSRFPFFTWRNALLFALSIALALNVRPGALLFLGYLVVLLLYRVLEQPTGSRRALAVTAAWIAVIALITLVAGSVFWPWALERPVYGPILGLAEVSRFGWDGWMLFNGRDVYGLDPQWDYVPRWLLITTPLVVIGGIAASLRLLGAKGPHHRAALALWAVVAFPIVYIIGVRAVMYDEVRHLLFVQPPIAILAAAGWTMLIAAPPKRWMRPAALAMLAVGLLGPVGYMWREHPNQVVYFNELAGGPGRQYGRYEMDYWGNCMLQALDRARQLAPVVRPVKISGWPGQILKADASRYPDVVLTELASRQHVVEVLLARGKRHEVLTLAARPDLLARVTTSDGALLCAVLRGPAWPADRNANRPIIPK